MFDTITDGHGNKIACEKSKRGGHKFYLYLKGHEYRRLIGHYFDGVLHFVRNPDHVYVKTNSYGFNDCFIRKFEPETKVVIREKGHKLKLNSTVGEILEKGQYLFFLVQGFEKQVFLNRNLFRV